jgi:hypothetical protein
MHYLYCSCLFSKEDYSFIKKKQKLLDSGAFWMHFSGHFKLAMIFVVSLFSAHALAEPIELKLGHIDPKGSIYWIATEEYAMRVNAKLAGRAVVKVYSGRTRHRAGYTWPAKARRDGDGACGSNNAVHCP